MPKMRLLVVTTLISAMLGAAPCLGEPPAEDTLDALLSAIRANRKALVAINLQLTDDEAGKFWPVYDRYQREINDVGDRFVALVRDYTTSFATLSNEKAMEIVRAYLVVEADRVKVRSSYVDLFAQTLPGRKLARLYQIENKMDAVIRYDLASTIPVMEN